MDLVHHRTGSGEPLVLIHGIGSRWQMWEPVMDRLAERHDVIALDLPGFGRSPMPAPGTPPGAASLATLVAEFLSQQGVERPHVAGNSLGGLIALELARRGQARSAIALSPAGFASSAEMTTARAQLWLSVRAARWMAPQARRLLGSVPARAVALSLFVARPGRMTADDAAESVVALAQAPWFDETLPSLGAMEFERVSGGGAAAIAVPVTIAWGDRDRLLYPRQAQRAAALIPDARVIALRGCGHVPTTDDPEQVARVILEATAAV